MGHSPLELRRGGGSPWGWMNLHLQTGRHNGLNADYISANRPVHAMQCPITQSTCQPSPMQPAPLFGWGIWPLCCTRGTNLSPYAQVPCETAMAGNFHFIHDQFVSESRLVAPEPLTPPFGRARSSHHPPSGRRRCRPAQRARPKKIGWSARLRKHLRPCGSSTCTRFPLECSTHSRAGMHPLEPYGVSSSVQAQSPASGPRLSQLWHQDLLAGAGSQQDPPATLLVPLKTCRRVRAAAPPMTQPAQELLASAGSWASPRMPGSGPACSAHPRCAEHVDWPRGLTSGSPGRLAPALGPPRQQHPMTSPDCVCAPPLALVATHSTSLTSTWSQSSVRNFPQHFRMCYRCSALLLGRLLRAPCSYVRP